MNILIITSSYPAYPDDPTGAAGLFIRDFALELYRKGHMVIIQPVDRKKHYQADEGLTIEPLPWRGGDQELASLNFLSPSVLMTVIRFFRDAKRQVIEAHQKYQVDRTLCMWALPAGLLGYWMHKVLHKPYDVWALGSDIWKIRKIPIIGKYLLKKIIGQAQNVFADGLQLGRDVEQIANRTCPFLASSRKLPLPDPKFRPLQPIFKKHFLYVGRFHSNKGTDLLFKALALLPNEIRAQIKVHVFGVGPLKNTLENLYQQLELSDIIDLNGPIKAQALANFLTHVDFLLIPSRIESIPVIFSDALQMGTPVIATPVGDLKALINKDQSGIVCKNASPDAIAQAIKRAMTYSRQDFQNAIQRTLRLFDIEHTVNKWQHTPYSDTNE